MSNTFHSFTRNAQYSTAHMYKRTYVHNYTHVHEYVCVFSRKLHTCMYVYAHAYGELLQHCSIHPCTVTLSVHCIFICILVRRKIKEKSVHTSALEAQVTDVCTGHQKGFIVGINCVRKRQEISKHISIAYNMLDWTMRIFAV